MALQRQVIPCRWKLKAKLIANILNEKLKKNEHRN